MKNIFFVLVVSISLALTSDPAIANTINQQTSVAYYAQNTTALTDYQLETVIGGDWVDSACAFLGGASAGAAAARVVSRLHPVAAIAIVAADIYCLFH